MEIWAEIQEDKEEDFNSLEPVLNLNLNLKFKLNLKQALFFFLFFFNLLNKIPDQADQDSHKYPNFEHITTTARTST